jgi:hypothetical protein
MICLFRPVVLKFEQCANEATRRRAGPALPPCVLPTHSVEPLRLVGTIPSMRLGLSVCWRLCCTPVDTFFVLPTNHVPPSCLPAPAPHLAPDTFCTHHWHVHHNPLHPSSRGVRPTARRGVRPTSRWVRTATAGWGATTSWVRPPRRSAATARVRWQHRGWLRRATTRSAATARARWPDGFERSGGCTSSFPFYAPARHAGHLQ